MKNYTSKKRSKFLGKINNLFNHKGRKEIVENDKRDNINENDKDMRWVAVVSIIVSLISLGIGFWSLVVTMDSKNIQVLEYKYKQSPSIEEVNAQFRVKAFEQNGDRKIRIDISDIQLKINDLNNLDYFISISPNGDVTVIENFQNISEIEKRVGEVFNQYENTLYTGDYIYSYNLLISKGLDRSYQYYILGGKAKQTLDENGSLSISVFSEKLEKYLIFETTLKDDINFDGERKIFNHYREVKDWIETNLK